MFELFSNALSYAFIQRALLAGIFVAITCAVLGFFLVLKRFALIGDGLAHTSFATVAIGLLLGLPPLTVSIPLVMLASLLILKLSEKNSMFGDSAIGLVSSLALAIGIFISNLAGGFNVDLFSYLFGSILAISSMEVWFSTVLSFVVIVLVLLFFPELFSITYDEDFARVIGIKTKAMNYLLTSITAITIVLGIRVVGTLLISALIIIPPVSALQIAPGFRSGIVTAAILAFFSVIIGIFLAFFLDFPAGATIVIINFIFFAAVYLFRKICIRQ